MPRFVTAERLRQVLDYDKDTGVFVWRKERGLNLAGKIAGCLTPRGGQCLDKFYYKIGVDGHRYYSHILAYLWMTGEYPSSEIDHKDGDGLNNKWDNLRAAEHNENGCNRNDLNKNNSSGFTGVSYHNEAKRWRARVMVNRVDVHVGFFDTREEAAKARYEKAKQLHGEFASNSGGVL